MPSVLEWFTLCRDLLRGPETALKPLNVLLDVPSMLSMEGKGQQAGR